MIFQDVHLDLLINNNSNFSQEDKSTTTSDSEHDSLYYQGLVQFSGVVVSSDSLQPVAFANIYDKSTRRGTVSDYYGYFSFVASLGDTIMFSFVGYKPSYYIIPDSLESGMYSIIHMMETQRKRIRNRQLVQTL